ncbi:MAG TPA: YHS domain-containing protein [Gemmatimonadaceae bacterium]|nr:YHS domain-containing protein [Gemmatimonadaceae bacterium]
MAQGTQARDPVCGMYVDTATATHRATFNGQTYYFCSPGCKRTFDANPAHYAERSVPVQGAGELEQHEPPFTKSDGIVAPKFGSAGSGGAEFERLPEAHDKDAK